MEFFKKMATISSIKKIEKGFYEMNVKYDYKLENLVKANIKNDLEFEIWLKKNIFRIMFDTSPHVTIEPIEKHCTSFAMEENEEIYCAHNEDLNDGTIILLRTNPRNGYRSIGLTISSMFGINNTKRSLKFTLLSLVSPFLTLDGMNEKGLSISTLSVEGRGLPITQKDNMGSIFMVRYLLDYATDTQHGIELLQQFNIWFNGNHPFQYFISDYNGNHIIVYFDRNGIGIIKNNAEYLIASNFIPDIVKENDNGYSRYKIVDDEIKKGNNNRIDILSKVFSGNTQWSSIHKLRSLTTELYLRKNLNKKYVFSI